MDVLGKQELFSLRGGACRGARARVCLAHACVRCRMLSLFWQADYNYFMRNRRACSTTCARLHTFNFAIFKHGHLTHDLGSSGASHTTPHHTHSRLNDSSNHHELRDREDEDGNLIVITHPQTIRNLKLPYRGSALPLGKCGGGMSRAI